ncbi:MAG: sulfite exporter TauE/SafE family protein [Pseudomonadota bacterium]
MMAYAPRWLPALSVALCAALILALILTVFSAGVAQAVSHANANANVSDLANPRVTAEPNLLILIAALLAAGIATGFISGLLGIGGGGILVPVLFEVFGALGVAEDVRMHLSVGTALCVILPTSLRSFLSHRAKGSVDTAVVQQMAFWVVAGVVAGSVIARFADASALKVVWIVVGAFLAIMFGFGRSDWRLGTTLPGSPALQAYGVVVGTLSTLMSVGGGAFITMMMTLYGRPMLQALGTASGFGPLVAIPGVLGFAWAGWGAANLPPFSVGYVNLLGAGIVVVASVVTAPLGVRLAHGIDRRTLEIAFAAFLAIVVVRFIVNVALGG